MISEKNITMHELIGLKAKTKKAKGLIVDESKNTITIWDKKKERMIPKQNNEFEIKTNGGEIIIKGEQIAQRPYDRLKKKSKVNNKWQKKSV